MGFVEYEITGDGAPYRVELRRSADAYERSIYNGTDEEWQRDVVASIGLLRRMYGASIPIPDEVIAAFNLWRAGEHMREIAKVRATYRDRRAFAPWEAPADVRGGVYREGAGWIATTRLPSVVSS